MILTISVMIVMILTEITDTNIESQIRVSDIKHLVSQLKKANKSIQRTVKSGVSLRYTLLLTAADAGVGRTRTKHRGITVWKASIQR